MQRLFWKFFIIIWLTMMLSIGALFALTDLLQLTPFSREMEQAQKTLALKVASQYLRDGDLAGAVAFVQATNKSVPALALSVTQFERSDCADKVNDSDASVMSGSACYQLATHGRITSAWDQVWINIVPWASALLAAGFAAYGLAYYLISPVKQLREGLRALAHGKFDIRIAEKMRGRRDEIADLANDFDASAARLDDVRTSQQRLFHDISHELRSPLSRLQAAIGVLQQNPSKVSSMLDRMNREIQRIDGMVGEILTLARLGDRAQAPLITQAVDILDLLNAIVADASFEGKPRGVRIALEGAASFVADVNGELIYRALENVVRNALKYSPDMSDVKVLAVVKDDLLVVTVTDEGPGVPPDELNSIFEPFARGQGSATHDGFGLGLAIAKQAIERHGGQISAKVEAGGGLAVTLGIPRVCIPGN